ncbi:polyisoprenoid-binding protein YceI [Thermosporothrix hazakensis]|jgi:polyisoprenoid-binding protein YceI|uniref:Polyisoprenoid-binding protein YceI n=1 Tax=Thermosporothrix hazakensis TaxID=644383 RepID=A0A326UEX8_THEHA|nr:YceI family protein [Thermosporothrix hazakensis]PZW36846.1 polyisoprenoid-binding protein YceI [Thermosporothrix hazakensis]GCE47494.1 polyisoprenoid-binding protein [Thermosporothrix hazakensis]
MTWQIDPSHSRVGFSVKHMMISTVRGQFNSFRGTLNIDEQNPAASWVEAEVDVASIDTGDSNRDAHLKSGEFFLAEEYPTITFKSTKVEPAGEGEYKVTGDLTLRGVTKPVVFDVEYGGQGKDPFGNVKAGLYARTKINRKDFGVNYHVVLESGGLLVGDEVKLELELEAVKSAE